VFFLAGSAAPSPLYPVYARQWGFSPIVTTAVFAVYAVAVLAALLTVGSISDHVGRRPVLFAAAATQVLAMAMFATAGGLTALLLARVVQGLATGAAVGAVGAGMVELHRSRGTIANAVAPATGTAIGAIGAGLLVQFLPAPTHLVYLVLAVIFAAQAVGATRIAETATLRPGAMASLRPRLAIPPAARRPLLIATATLLAVWAIAGFYLSLGPSLVRTLSGSNSYLLSGAAIFTLAASGAVSVLILHASQDRTFLLVGISGLIVGVVVTLESISTASLAAFFVGTLIAGLGFGAGFQGAIRTVLAVAEPHQRTHLLSTMYVVSYLSMGLPAVAAGVLVVYGGGLVSTTREYASAALTLAVLALVGVLMSARRRGNAPPLPAMSPRRLSAGCAAAPATSRSSGPAARPPAQSGRAPCT